MYDSRAVAKRVKEAREAAGFGQKDVAKRLGLTEAGYGHYERDRQTFTAQQLFELERILGRPVSWFLGIATQPGELSDDERLVLSMYERLRYHNRGQEIIDLLQALTKRLKEE